MKNSIEIAHKPTLIDRRLREGLREYTIFFWEITAHGIRAFVVKVMGDAKVPGEALRMARACHPTGTGFCFADGGGGEVPSHRPRPPRRELQGISP
jgi:hypothetical protein